MSQTYKLGSHATTVATNDGMTRVTYHRTVVVAFNHERTILNSDGWKTVTTKTRMNQASNQFGLGYRVYQRDYNWYVEFAGKDHDYNDHMILHAEGRVEYPA